jgi:hypothetical protein
MNERNGSASRPDDRAEDLAEDSGGTEDVLPDIGDEERPADEKLVPRPAPGLGPIGPAGDPSYMEGTLRGRGPRVGFYITVGVVAVLVLIAMMLVLRG